VSPQRDEGLVHASSDVLELYALGRLLEEEIASLEEHLIQCELCRNLLDSIEEQMHLLRSALWHIEVAQGIAARNPQGVVIAFPTVPKKG
jgi:anti-sigma factor RsiW